MNDSRKKARGKSEPDPKRAGGVDRRVRADARRNMDAVLEAAKAVFVASGVDAPVREIADKAGVGVGTVYRHFPRRSDLVAAVFRREVDACATAAAVLAKAHGPGDALGKWLRRYTSFIATKRGLASALHSGDPTFDALPAYFQQHLGPALQSLLDAASAAGQGPPRRRPQRPPARRQQTSADPPAKTKTATAAEWWTY